MQRIDPNARSRGRVGTFGRRYRTGKERTSKVSSEWQVLKSTEKGVGDWSIGTKGLSKGYSIGELIGDWGGWNF